MLTFPGSYSGPDTDVRSYHSYGNCWTVVGHSPNDDHFLSFHRCINHNLESKDHSQKVILMTCGEPGITVLSLWFKSLPPIICPLARKNTKLPVDIFQTWSFQSSSLNPVLQIETADCSHLSILFVCVFWDPVTLTGTHLPSPQTFF